MFLSVFDLFKIGIGPSSSHTMGPMLAANRFLHFLRDGDWVRPPQAEVSSLSCSLHGSLAFTGKGHGTDRAVILGLMGCLPSTLDPDASDAIISRCYSECVIDVPDFPPWSFDPSRSLIFDYDEVLEGHTNGMKFSAYDSSGTLLVSRVYYSIGGGFVVDELELGSSGSDSSASPVNAFEVPFLFSDASTLVSLCREHNKSISDLQKMNERAYRSATGDIATLESDILSIWGAMESCVNRGLSQEGELPGGLHVKRRAKGISEKLKIDETKNMQDPLLANDWLSVFAMAVNEENAAGGRVVTAPTNGAAGVIPAVMSYHRRFSAGVSNKDMEDFLLTAAAIGGIIKNNASISGAEVGCQGEVGSASAMAAAGLAAVMGGTVEQIENAAEIALEHHLGMTCDPVSGLVQVPCIERNAFGAVKAVTAASLALHGDGKHIVPLDVCIKTMYETGLDMSSRYKETSQGGLAVNVVAC